MEFTLIRITFPGRDEHVGCGLGNGNELEVALLLVQLMNCKLKRLSGEIAVAVE